MKSIEQLEKQYDKEMQLAEQHKKNAADIKKQIESQMGKTISQKINTLNMTGTEYDRLIKLLSSGKKSVLEAVKIVLDKDETEPKSEEGGEQVNETVLAAT